MAKPKIKTASKKKKAAPAKKKVVRARRTKPPEDSNSMPPDSPFQETKDNPTPRHRQRPSDLLDEVMQRQNKQRPPVEMAGEQRQAAKEAAAQAPQPGPTPAPPAPGPAAAPGGPGSGHESPPPPPPAAAGGAAGGASQPEPGPTRSKSDPDDDDDDDQDDDRPYFTEDEERELMEVGADATTEAEIGLMTALFGDSFQSGHYGTDDRKILKVGWKYYFRVTGMTYLPGWLVLLMVHVSYLGQRVGSKAARAQVSGAFGRMWAKISGKKSTQPGPVVADVEPSNGKDPQPSKKTVDFPAPGPQAAAADGAGSRFRETDDFEPNPLA